MFLVFAGSLYLVFVVEWLPAKHHVVETPPRLQVFETQLGLSFLDALLDLPSSELPPGLEGPRAPSRPLLLRGHEIPQEAAIIGPAVPSDAFENVEHEPVGKPGDPVLDGVRRLRGPVSMEQARVWFRKAAEQGQVDAQYNLAIMHRYGKGGPVSMEQACVWWGRAAEQGHVKAQFNLALMRKQGLAE